MAKEKPIEKTISWKYALSEILLGQEEENAVLEVIRSKWLSMGPKTESLEAEFKKASGTSYALATSNCTTALHLAVSSLELQAGDEVIVPALSFVATANVVVCAGARPVFADIESLSRPLLDPQDVERKISPRTRAMIVMHYAGYPCRMTELKQIAMKHRLAIIEDAAHAVGSRFENQPCGALGDIGCFSFFGNKNLPAGEGGMIVTRDERRYLKMKSQRSHGMTSLSWDRFKGHSSGYDVTDIGYNYRMPELTAAVALCQLHKLPVHNQARDFVFDSYVENLRSEKRLLIPFSSAQAPGGRHLMPVLLDEKTSRTEFMKRLASRGIQSSIHYPPIYSFSFYRNSPSLSQSALPVTEEFSNRVVTLPFHPGLDRRAVDEISEVVLESLK